VYALQEQASRSVANSQQQHRLPFPYHYHVRRPSKAKKLKAHGSSWKSDWINRREDRRLGEHYEYVKGKHDSQEAIVEQQWKCTKCNDLINLDAAATTALSRESVVMCIVVNLAMKRFCTQNINVPAVERSSSSVLPYSFGGLRYVWQRICFVLQSVRANATRLRSLRLSAFTSTTVMNAEVCMKTCGVHDCGPRACNGCKEKLL
jgi:hypothetical protein